MLPNMVKWWSDRPDCVLFNNNNKKKMPKISRQIARRKYFAITAFKSIFENETKLSKLILLLLLLLPLSPKLFRFSSSRFRSNCMNNLWTPVFFFLGKRLRCVPLLNIVSKWKIIETNRSIYYNLQMLVINLVVLFSVCGATWYGGASGTSQVCGTHKKKKRSKRLMANIKRQ